MVDGGAIALVAIVGLEVVAICAAVAYLLYRRYPAATNESKLEPDGKITNDYEQPGGTNGHIVVEVEEESSVKEKNTDSLLAPPVVDSPITEQVSVKIEDPGQHETPPIDVEVENKSGKVPEAFHQLPEGDAVPPYKLYGSSSSLDDQNENPALKEISSSLSSESENETKKVPLAEESSSSSSENEPEIKKVVSVKDKESSSSSSENEHEIKKVVSVKDKESSSSSSENEPEIKKVVSVKDKESSSSSSENELEIQKVVLIKDKKSSSSSSENEPEIKRVVSVKDKESSSSSSENELEIKKMVSVKDKESSSSSSENELKIQKVVSVKNIESSSPSSENEPEIKKVVSVKDKESSSSSSENEPEIKKVVSVEDKESSSSSSENEPDLKKVVLVKEKDSSSSSSSSVVELDRSWLIPVDIMEDYESALVKPIVTSQIITPSHGLSETITLKPKVAPRIKSTRVKINDRPTSPKTTLSGGVQTLIVTDKHFETKAEPPKIKNKKSVKRLELKNQTSSSSDSGEVEVFNHKKKIHRKKFIHNIEEEEIIEEPKVNRKQIRLIKTPAVINSSSTSGENETAAMQKPIKLKTKKGFSATTSSSTPFSLSEEKELKENKVSELEETKFSSQYYYDVTTKDDRKHVTRTVIEKEISPTKSITKHHVYKEVITEDKVKDLSINIAETSSSDNESDTRLKSEKVIQIKAAPNLNAFRVTVATKEAEKPSINVSSSAASTSSTSSENEIETRIKSKKVIMLQHPPKIAKELEDNAEKMTLPSSKNDAEKIKIYAHKDIRLKKKKKEELAALPTPPQIETKMFPLESLSSPSSSSSADEKEVIHFPPQTSSPSLEKRVNHSEANKMSATEDFNTRQISEESCEIKRKPVEKRKSRENIKFTSGWKRQVTLENLFKAGVLSETTISELEEGKIEKADVEKSLQIYLVGEEPLAGLILSDTGDKLSIYEAWKKGLMRKGTSISLLEAQAATGRILDPKTAAKYSVKEAMENKLIDRQFEAILTRAERAVYGYTSRLSKETLSLFEAMKRGLVVENHGIRLLEAQIATGGIIDPNANHRLPVEVAFDRGLFDKRLHDILEDPSDDTRGFFDPNTEENLTYLELLERCVIDKDTGMKLLPFRTKQKKTQEKGSKVLFESESKRQVLLRDVLVADLIDADTARKYQDGRLTSKEVNDLVAKLKVFVDGRKPIAGIINSITGEKMSILEAYRSNLIKKGTALELFEAQAACGKIIDVQSGKVVSIETALRMGVIDSEYEDVVSRAHRAVMGFREPFKREALSLCEAISRHLLVERQGTRMLEAQIATGGIIELKSPVRISAEVALKRRLLDATLSKKLEAKSTRSYFDPITGENLNYSELMEKCVLDKDTNLLYLTVEGGAVSKSTRSHQKKKETTPSKVSSPKNYPKPSKRSLQSKASASTLALPSSPTATLNRRVVIVDPNTNEDLTVQEALKRHLLDEVTAKQLMAQEGDFKE